jgi:hypothetical protein
MASILGVKYSFLENRDKESSTKFLVVGLIVGYDIDIEDFVKTSTAQLRLTGGAQPIFENHLRFAPSL